MANIPLGVSSTLITGVFAHAALDAVKDLDREPDGLPADGLQIRIVASVPRVRNLNSSPAVEIALDPIVAYTTSDGVLRGQDDGEGVRIISSDDPNIRPTADWYYTATITGDGWPTEIINFEAKSNGNFDLVRDADLPLDVEGAVNEYRRLKQELQAMIDNFNGEAIAILG